MLHAQQGGETNVASSEDGERMNITAMQTNLTDSWKKEVRHRQGSVMEDSISVSHKVGKVVTMAIKDRMAPMEVISRGRILWYCAQSFPNWNQVCPSYHALLSWQEILYTALQAQGNVAQW